MVHPIWGFVAPTDPAAKADYPYYEPGQKVRAKHDPHNDGGKSDSSNGGRHSVGVGDYLTVKSQRKGERNFTAKEGGDGWYSDYFEPIGKPPPSPAPKTLSDKAMRGV